MGSRTELGEFLRTRRSRITPEEVGLPSSAGIRRTAGLRREEVAILAGVSIEYYRRLEQGKQQRPSGAVLAAIAQVLKLSEDEHRHLTELSRSRPNEVAGQTHQRRASRTVRDEVRRMLDVVLPYPACVLSRSSDLLAANDPALCLFPGIEDWPERRRNTARYAFLHPAARQLYGNWDDVARGVVAHLRTAIVLHPGAPELQELVSELSEHSPEFADLWRRYDVRTRTNGRKVYHHPVAGSMTLTYEAFDVARSDGQRLVVYQAAPHTRDHDALLLLARRPSPLAPTAWEYAAQARNGAGELTADRGAP
ncbi:helix-turn-helix transcriptional regulator [Streptomyces sp. RPT161]|uniref:helix-turn-helix transcriptional regulator n=1 Tax=Streptomyces sp. RPT161 TaxID=3015993 RepID=UPI0022B8AA36|nr:helix-turn-helix transcriptional regulator [Streptomyces sp. RPT161]